MKRGNVVETLKLNIVAWALAAGLLLVLSGNALAHPHVWIDARTEVIFGQGQRVTALRVSWRFDEFYSLFAIEGLDKDGNGDVDAEELQPLAELNVTSLKEYRYFTYATAAGKEVAYGPVSDYHSTYEDGILTLEFVIPFEEPVDPVMTELRFLAYDPTFYIAIEPPLQDPVSLRSAPAHCRAVETKTPQGEVLQLSEADFLDPAANEAIGRLYATEFAVSCAPAGVSQ